MKTFDLIVGKSAGNIVFGMSRNEARELLGDYTEYDNGFVIELNKQTNSSLEVKSYDQFSFCSVGYDSNGNIDFVSFHTLNDIQLKFNDKIISDMTGLELFSYLSELDSNIDVETGGVGFISHKLGIAAFFDKTDVILLDNNKQTALEKLETITIAVPGYWDKEKGE